jgi:hypothetical protein
MRSKPYCKFPIPVDPVGNRITYVIAASVGVSLGIIFMLLV